MIDRREIREHRSSLWIRRLRTALRSGEELGAGAESGGSAETERRRMRISFVSSKVFGLSSVGVSGDERPENTNDGRTPATIALNQLRSWIRSARVWIPYL